MLQIAQEFEHEIQLAEKTDDALYCRACGHLVTRRRWLLDRGGIEHRLTNPLGVTFTVICFIAAPGAARFGTPTREHSWFEGYEWCFALCRGCEAHLGWSYHGTTEFFGLIKDRLSAQKTPTGPGSEG